MFKIKNEKKKFLIIQKKKNYKNLYIKCNNQFKFPYKMPIFYMEVYMNVIKKQFYCLNINQKNGKTKKTDLQNIWGKIILKNYFQNNFFVQKKMNLKLAHLNRMQMYQNLLKKQKKNCTSNKKNLVDFLL